MRGRYSNKSDLRNLREEEQRRERYYKAIQNLCTAVIALCVATLLLFAMSGCTTTRVITVETVKHDTTYINKIQKDSVWLHDSIHVKEKGDSVIIEKWHTQWRDRLLIDTVYKSKVDSIPVPYEVVKEVEKELSSWQKTQMYAGDVLLAVIFGLLLFGGWKLLKKINVI